MPNERSRPFYIYAAIVADAAIAVSKFVAGILAGSSAMIAEGVHSTIDTANTLLLLLGIHRARKAPDESHPFGHGRELYFWVMMVAVSTFGIGGGVSIYDGVKGILRPGPLDDPLLSYIVLGVSGVFSLISVVISYREYRSRRISRRGLWRAFHASKDPTVFTVLFEDIAAVLGLIMAFLGVFLSHRLGRPVFDGIASIVIGAMLAGVAGLIAFETKGLLVGETADPEMVGAIETIARADPDVVCAAKPLTMQLAPHQILLCIEVQFRDRLNSRQLSEAVDRLEAAITARFPDVRRIFIEAEALRKSEAPPEDNERASDRPVSETCPDAESSNLRPA